MLSRLSAESEAIFPESVSNRLALDNPSLHVLGKIATQEQQGHPEFWYVHCTDLDRMSKPMEELRSTNPTFPKEIGVLFSEEVKGAEWTRLIVTHIGVF